MSGLDSGKVYCNYLGMNGRIIKKVKVNHNDICNTKVPSGNAISKIYFTVSDDFANEVETNDNNSPDFTIGIPGSGVFYIKCDTALDDILSRYSNPEGVKLVLSYVLDNNTEIREIRSNEWVYNVRNKIPNDSVEVKFLVQSEISNEDLSLDIIPLFRGDAEHCYRRFPGAFK
ncbi:hypothetical protein H4219_002642 [Mycoemilia scoparia]|uniref:Uncharacterized protein n=1 Tax=Mycoemilia scoparia TaxID=417184 RepID=A0A9W8DQA8_9FUNG|nr:hypothetical protein H4219_002642 [Mycoemilia scoparia]